MAGRTGLQARRSRLARSWPVGVGVVASLLLLGLMVGLPAPPATAFGTAQPPPIPSVSAGTYMSCGVQVDGTAACWGEDGVPSNDILDVHPGKVSTPPAGVQFLEVSAGYANGCGVKLDRTIVCWGSGRYTKVNIIPAGQYKHVVAGQHYICALRVDDTIKCWGGDDPTIDPDRMVIRDAPAGKFTQVTVGSRHACALRADGSGTVVCWGVNTTHQGVFEAQTTVPAGTYKWVDTGDFTPCALRTDGTPVCWGRNSNAQQTYPKDTSGNFLTFTEISSGSGHLCGRRPDKTVVCWGSNDRGQASPVPPGAFTQVTAGTFHSCGMREGESTAVCWGDNSSGRVQPNMASEAPPRAYVDVNYSANFTMNRSPLGGTGVKAGISPAPIFSSVEGTLPPGLSLLPDGRVYGTPEASGSYTVKVSAGNGLSPRDCWKAGSADDPMLCIPGDPTSLATATRVFTFDVAPEVPAPGAISGRLTSSADGTGIAGATVAIAYSDTTPIGETTTDANGIYTFESLLPDTYKVTASGFGFTTQTKPTTVNSNLTSTVDLSLVSRLPQPRVSGVWSNHWQTVSDGVFVEWSEEFDILQQDGSAYKVHGPSDSSCTATPVATSRVANWTGENPNTTTPRFPSRTSDVEMAGYGNVVPGATYHLRVEANAQFGFETGQRSVLECVPYVAQLRPSDRGAVTGKVTSSATGAPIAGAAVAVKRTAARAPGTLAGQATTDADGSYRVSDLPPSSYPIAGYNLPYEVVVSAPGHLSGAARATTTFNHLTATTSTATLDIALVADAPDAVDDTYATDEDTPLAIESPGVVGNDTGPEGATISARVVTGPSHGTIVLGATGAFTYTPNANYNGADSFTYSATASPGAADTATVTINVNPVNDAPSAGDDAYSHNGSDTALVVSAAAVLANDLDVEGSPLTASLSSGPTNGMLNLNPDGSFTYQPREDFIGTDSFTYRSSDGSASSGEATVTITVRAGCRGQAATITGSSAGERLTGTSGVDVIAGLGGHDTLNGAGGHDVICGGSGKDSIDGGSGDDYADGGSGDDKLKGHAGSDTLLGGAGTDDLIGNNGNDTLAGGSGSRDSCHGGGGADSLAADHGCERINGVT